MNSSANAVPSIWVLPYSSARVANTTATSGVQAGNSTYFSSVNGQFPISSFFPGRVRWVTMSEPSSALVGMKVMPSAPAM